MKIKITDRITVLDEETQHRVGKVTQRMKLGSTGEILKRMGIVSVIVGAIGLPVLYKYVQTQYSDDSLLNELRELGEYDEKLEDGAIMKLKTGFEALKLATGGKMSVAAYVLMAVLSTFMTVLGYHYVMTRLLNTRYQYFMAIDPHHEKLAINVHLMTKDNFRLQTREKTVYFIHRQDELNFTVADASNTVLFSTKDHPGAISETAKRKYLAEFLQRAELTVTPPAQLGFPEEILYIGAVVVFLTDKYREASILAMLKLFARIVGIGGPVAVVAFLMGKDLKDKFSTEFNKLLVRKLNPMSGIGRPGDLNRKPQ